MNAHEKELHLLAAALLEFETLTYDEIQMVVAGKDISDLRKQTAATSERLRKENEEMYKQVSPPALPPVNSEGWKALDSALKEQKKNQ